MVSIKGLDKAVVLKALHDASKTQGRGSRDYSPEGLTLKQCQDLLINNKIFSCIQGRVLNVDLSTSEVDPWSYDRVYGEGSLETVVDSLRNS